MTRVFHGQLLAVVAVVAATVAACGGGPDQPSPRPATTPAPPATSTATSTATASPPPTTTPTTAPSPRATATASPSPTPAPATATASASASPTPVAPGATTFRYDTYDTTGAVSTPGSYAFLSDPDDTSTAVTTYEALRDGTTTALLIHTSDAGGASRGSVYDAVQAGDLFEWHKADDCFVRYQVTEVKPDPAGTVPRKSLAVWAMTYTYTGCSGTIPSTTSVTLTWGGVLKDLGGPSLPAPVMHGPYQLVPLTWQGEVQGWEDLELPWPDDPVVVDETNPSRATLLKLPYWRDPDLPEGWYVYSVTSGSKNDPAIGYNARFYSPGADGGLVLKISGYYVAMSGYPFESSTAELGVHESRVIAGRLALASYNTPKKGEEGYDPFFVPTLWIYDHATGTGYTLTGYGQSVRDIDILIEIAASLFEDGYATSLLPTPDATTPLAAPAATTFRYDSYDTTGAVSTPGSYAFLADPDDTSTVVTTYEGLRDGTATALLIHTSDADGASRGSAYDAVEAGDLFEWHKADDCFVRYQVTEVKPDPAGTVPRKLLGVAWLTYAFAGCSGTIETGGEHRIGWSPANITSPDVTSPIRHGNWLIVPQDWTGAMEEYVLVPYRENPECEGDEPTTLEEHAFGRRPALPDDWVVENIREMMCDLLHVTYRSADWTADIDVYISRQWAVPFHIPWVDPSNTHEVVEATMIDGHPAVLRYDSRGFFNLNVKIYHSSGIKYEVWTRSQSLVSNRQAVIDIARSLYDTPSPTPATSAATTFRYGTYDTTGAVSTPGSYAFLSDPDDTSTAVTTYEALRDGTTTALLIHTSDADGASRADVYDAVEAGDLFEWHKADDCFVRYTVEEVMAAPAGSAPRKLLGVAWMTFAFIGCRGETPLGSAELRLGSLPVLGGASLAVPVRHGPFQILPEDWRGVRSYEEYGDPAPLPENSTGSDGPFFATDIAVARQHAYWREPTLPARWTFLSASGGSDVDPVYGYCAMWSTETGGLGVEICAYYVTGTVGGFPASYVWTNRGGDESGHIVHETRVVDGRPAVVTYSPRGEQYDWRAGVDVYIYDPETGIAYWIQGSAPPLRGDGADAGIAIARSLFD